MLALLLLSMENSKLLEVVQELKDPRCSSRRNNINIIIIVIIIVIIIPLLLVLLLY